MVSVVIVSTIASRGDYILGAHDHFKFIQPTRRLEICFDSSFALEIFQMAFVVHKPLERRIVETLVVIRDFFLAIRAVVQLNRVSLRDLAYPIFVVTDSVR